MIFPTGMQEKSTLQGSDQIIVADASDSNNAKKGLLSSVWTYIKAQIDAVTEWVFGVIKTDTIKSATGKKMLVVEGRSGDGDYVEEKLCYPISGKTAVKIKEKEDRTSRCIDVLAGNDNRDILLVDINSDGSMYVERKDTSIKYYNLRSTGETELHYNTGNKFLSAENQEKLMLYGDITLKDPNDKSAIRVEDNRTRVLRYDDSGHLLTGIDLRQHSTVDNEGLMVLQATDKITIGLGHTGTDLSADEIANNTGNGACIIIGSNRNNELEEDNGGVYIMASKEIRIHLPNGYNDYDTYLSFENGELIFQYNWDGYDQMTSFDIDDIRKLRTMIDNA